MRQICCDVCSPVTDTACCALSMVDCQLSVVQFATTDMGKEELVTTTSKSIHVVSEVAKTFIRQGGSSFRRRPSGESRATPEVPRKVAGQFLPRDCSSAEEGSRLRLNAPEVGWALELGLGNKSAAAFRDRLMVKLLGDIGKSWVVG